MDTDFDDHSIRACAKYSAILGNDFDYLWSYANDFTQ